MEANIIIWLCFHCINALIAYINNHERLEHIATKNPAQVDHPLWGFLYGATCAIQWYFNKENWWLVGSILLLHISIFPVIYNLFSDVPVFNLSKTTSAITDKLMVKIGLKNTAIINITAYVISATLLVLSIIKP